ncbi:MAG: 3-oxoacid CoA-transferase subunit B [Hyphomicrobiales bacterium]|nr:3-oxoacid CoA-transferase subunit B [Hyphomicrobiales bacterium]
MESVIDPKDAIARRAAYELADGEIVNLGFGMPTAVANHIPPGVDVILQSENGCLMFGPTPRLGQQDADVANAGGQPITLLPGASIFDLATSFAIIRGGHVDTTILGALEVDQEGCIANWAMPVAPGKYSPGMGGAMDLVGGARKVVAVLQHTDKKGNSKVLKKCTLPVTGRGVLDRIITEKAVFDVTPNGLVLTEIAAGLTPDELKSMTDAEFSVSPDLCEYRLCA